MKRTTITTVAATTVAAIAISAAAVLAVPAAAADAYTPALAPTTTTSVKVAVDEAAAYTASAAKRVAAVARKRTARRAARKVTTVSSTSVATSDEARARSVLAGLIAKYPILAGTTVEMGDARGYQAIAYYSSGRIIISRTHTASIERILNHEIWHVIDYRDNGSINWGENLPPANASSFAN